MAWLMSEEDQALLTRSRPQLVKRLDMQGTLVAELQARGGLTEEQKQLVMNEPGQNKQADKLVDLLIRSGTEHTVDKMYYSLKDSEQMHIVTAFLRTPKTSDHSWTAIGNPTAPAEPTAGVPPQAAMADGSDIPMTKQHKKRLKQHRITLQASIDPQVTIDLLRYGVLDSQEAQQILAPSAREEQVGLLLDKLQEMSDAAYSALRVALNESDRQFLANLLL